MINTHRGRHVAIRPRHPLLGRLGVLAVSFLTVVGLIANGSAQAAPAPVVVHAPHAAVTTLAAPVVTYSVSRQGTCQGHAYTLTGTFQYDPNMNKRRGIAGSFQGVDWTQIIHDFQVGATSSGGGALSATKVVDSIAGSSAVSGKWGTGVQITIYLRVYRTLYKCAGGIGA